MEKENLLGRRLDQWLQLPTKQREWVGEKRGHSKGRLVDGFPGEETLDVYYLRDYDVYY